jgi:hypothetical protein
MTHTQKREVLRLRGQGQGYAQIADAVGLTKSTVKSFCWRNQQQAVKTADPFKDLPAGLCPNCGKAIEQAPRQKPRRFCCDHCRRTWWNRHRDAMQRRDTPLAVCACCAKPFDHQGDRGRRYCCHPCYIADRFGGVPS